MKNLTIELPNKERLMMVEVPEDAYDIFQSSGDTPFADMPNQTFLQVRCRTSESFNLGLGFENDIEILGEYSPQSGIDFPEKVKEEWLFQKVDFPQPDHKSDKIYEVDPQLFKSVAKSLSEVFESLLKHETEKQWTLKENPLGTQKISEEHKSQAKIDSPDYWKDHDEALNNLASVLNKRWEEVESKVMPKRFVCLLIR